MYPICILFHSRNVVLGITDFLHDEKQFVSSFLKRSRECYNCLLFPKNPNHPSILSSKHLFDASVTHTIEGFVEEVKIM